MNEFEIIDWLKRKTPKSSRVRIGIGDDAAVLKAAPGRNIVFATDVIVEGVDFRIKKAAPEKVGRKALAVNLSDLAAMGARPLAFVTSLGVPKGCPAAYLKRVHAGMMKLARKHRIASVGGDLSRARELFLSIAVLGEARGSDLVTRDGARAGDWIAVSGVLGGSIRGRHFDFEPRLKQSAWLVKNFKPTSMVDVSDGLIQDLSHVLKASGKSAELDLAAVPVSPDARKLSGGRPRQALEHALVDGEDFELLWTVAAKRRGALDRAWKRAFPRLRLSWIGRIRAGRAKISFTRNGRPVKWKLKKKGFMHF